MLKFTLSFFIRLWEFSCQKIELLIAFWTLKEFVSIKGVWVWLFISLSNSSSSERISSGLSSSVSSMVVDSSYKELDWGFEGGLVDE